MTFETSDIKLSSISRKLFLKLETQIQPFTTIFFRSTHRFVNLSRCKCKIVIILAVEG